MHAARQANVGARGADVDSVVALGKDDPHLLHNVPGLEVVGGEREGDRRACALRQWRRLEEALKVQVDVLPTRREESMLDTCVG